MSTMKVKCPVCGNDDGRCVCFQHEENLLYYICGQCGYNSFNTYTVGSKNIESLESNMPEILKQSRFIDAEREIVWYPMFIHIQEGMIFIDGDSEHNWKWAVARYRPETSVDRLHNEDLPKDKLQSSAPPGTVLESEHEWHHFERKDFYSAFHFLKTQQKVQ